LGKIKILRSQKHLIYVCGYTSGAWSAKLTAWKGLYNKSIKSSYQACNREFTVRGWETCE